MALTICTWLWGTKYSTMYVERLYRGLRQQLRQSFRFIVLTENHRIANFTIGIERHAIPNPELTTVKGCFVRLRMFDPVWQAWHGISGKIVSIDLDAIVTGELDPLFDRDDSIVLLKGANAANPCPFNGSIYMFRAGAHAELWTRFSLAAVKDIKQYEFPDDQGWFWHMIPTAATWEVGVRSGIYAFRKPQWPRDDHLPADARLVVFPGKRDPIQFSHLPWIRKHWR